MRRRAGRTITALECLAQSDEKRLVPDASTKMFLDFLQDYAPGRPSRSRLNKIYEVRSLVAHGERLLGYDTPQAHGLYPASTADREWGTAAVLLAVERLSTGSSGRRGMRRQSYSGALPKRLGGTARGDARVFEQRADRVPRGMPGPMSRLRTIRSAHHDVERRPRWTLA
jgi:hypothetical protein